MADFFSHLVEQSRGTYPGVQPLITPLFASAVTLQGPEESLAVMTTHDVTLDEQSEATHAPALPHDLVPGDARYASLPARARQAVAPTASSDADQQTGTVEPMKEAQPAPDSQETDADTRRGDGFGSPCPPTMPRPHNPTRARQATSVDTHRWQDGDAGTGQPRGVGTGERRVGTDGGVVSERGVGTGRPQGIAPTFPSSGGTMRGMEQDIQHTTVDTHRWQDDGVVGGRGVGTTRGMEQDIPYTTVDAHRWQDGGVGTGRPPGIAPTSPSSGGTTRGMEQDTPHTTVDAVRLTENVGAIPGGLPVPTLRPPTSHPPMSTPIEEPRATPVRPMIIDSQPAERAEAASEAVADARTPEKRAGRRSTTQRSERSTDAKVDVTQNHVRERAEGGSISPVNSEATLDARMSRSRPERTYRGQISAQEPQGLPHGTQSESQSISQAAPSRHSNETPGGKPLRDEGEVGHDPQEMENAPLKGIVPLLSPEREARRERGSGERRQERRNTGARAGTSGLADSQDARAGDQELPAQPVPDVRVRIGRIDVRATSPVTPPAPKRSGPSRPALTLSEYLERRRREGQ